MDIVNQAIQVLHRAVTPFGIVAATGNEDNYTRIWSRDAVIAGLAGCMANDPIIMAGLKQSVLTLMQAQKAQGQIPSNVLVDAHGTIQNSSYGTMAMRVDAITWWIIGAVSILKQASASEQAQLYAAVEKAIDLLEALEYNGRGLVYVPIGGNWADEYVTQGYTLYDQLLRLQALQLAAKAWQREDWQAKADFISQVLRHNYWQTAPNELPNPYRYRPAEADKKLHIEQVPYWICSLSPAGYDTRFDLFANALALLSPICDENQAHSVLQYVQTLMQHTQGLIPTFYPTIQPHDAAWRILEAHYLYRFKNQPGHFHNGGIWAMTLGWIGLAAQKWQQNQLAQQLLTNISPYFNHKTAKQPTSATANNYTLYEYLSSSDYKAGGIPDLSFTAAGIIMLHIASISKDQLLCWEIN
jgi:hypothetical protein